MATHRCAPAGLRGPAAGAAGHVERLRFLARVDETTAGGGDGSVPDDHGHGHGLDDRTAALARLAALVALRAAPASYRCGVELALASGATVDEAVATLKVVAHIVGLSRVVSAAPELALALGYDIDDALESLDDPHVDSSRPDDAGDTGTAFHGPRRAVPPPSRSRRGNAARHW